MLQFANLGSCKWKSFGKCTRRHVIVCGKAAKFMPLQNTLVATFHENFMIQNWYDLQYCPRDNQKLPQNVRFFLFMLCSYSSGLFCSPGYISWKLPGTLYLFTNGCVDVKSIMEIWPKTSMYLNLICADWSISFS